MAAPNLTTYTGPICARPTLSDILVGLSPKFREYELAHENLAKVDTYCRHILTAQHKQSLKRIAISGQHKPKHKECYGEIEYMIKKMALQLDWAKKHPQKEDEPLKNLLENLLY